MTSLTLYPAYNVVNVQAQTVCDLLAIYKDFSTLHYCLWLGLGDVVPARNEEQHPTTLNINNDHIIQGNRMVVACYL